jgi:hypothetical protein
MNPRTFNLVVGILGGTIGVALVGIIVLAGLRIDIPGVLENIAVAALAGMTGLLARSPGAEEAQPVRVTNDPLPVEDSDDRRRINVTRAVSIGRSPSTEPIPAQPEELA